MQCSVKKGKETIWNPEEISDRLLGFCDFRIYAGCLNNKESNAEISSRYEKPNSDICPNRETFLAGSF